MKQRLLTALNIKPAESNYVFDLLRIQLFIGIANSFINIVAFTFFIHHFAVAHIASAYIVIAGFLLLLNIGYEKLESKLSPLHLLRAVIAISGGVLVLFWIGLMAWDQTTVIFSLLVWSTLVYMMTGYAYWGLVSILFNVRESKRVFSIVGSGDIPAKLIGYMLSPLLIPIIGIENLLLLAIGSLAIGLYFLTRVIQKKGWKRLEHRAQKSHPVAHGPKSSLLSFFFQNKLIFFISFLSLLSYNVFNLIDYTFVTEIKAKIQNISSLATYIAIFFAVGRLATLVLKLIFTSRMIERLGIITCLMITPVVLFVCSMLFVLFDQSTYTLYEFGIMAMLTEVLRSAMQEPVFFILFQPLNEHNRLRGHIIAKGYMLAPSLLIVGASLLFANQAGVSLSISFIIKTLLVNLVIWGVIIYFLRKAYVKALHQSIAKGLFSGDQAVIEHPATLAVLVQKATDGNTAEKIYALRLLENIGHDGLQPLLEKSLLSADSGLKKYALDRLQAADKLTAPLLEKAGATAIDDDAKETVLTALCRLDPVRLRSLAVSLPTLSPGLRKSLTLLLLQQKEFGLFYTGCQQIQWLLLSEQPADRELALEIIGQLKELEFTDAIIALINDINPAVKRNALVAACKTQSQHLLPTILQRLQTPDKFLAMQGLFHYGDLLFEHLAPHAEIVRHSTPELVKIAAKVKGPSCTQFLLNLLRNSNGEAGKIIHVLWLKSYRAETADDRHLFGRLLQAFLQHGLKKISFHAAVPDCADKEILKRSVDAEMWTDLGVTLKACAILYGQKELNRVIEVAENQDRHKLYNAMEMLELVVPQKTARDINDLLDYLLDPLVKKKHAAAHDTGGFLRRVVVDNSLGFNFWTKSMCLYSFWRNHLTSFLVDLNELPTDENPLYRETRTYVLNNLSKPQYADY